MTVIKKKDGKREIEYIVKELGVGYKIGRIKWGEHQREKNGKQRISAKIKCPLRSHMEAFFRIYIFIIYNINNIIIYNKIININVYYII